MRRILLCIALSAAAAVVGVHPAPADEGRVYLPMPAGDFTGDGSPDVIAPTDTSYQARNGRTGEVLWSIPHAGPYGSVAPAVIGDGPGAVHIWYSGTAIEHPVFEYSDSVLHIDAYDRHGRAVWQRELAGRFFTTFPPSGYRLDWPFPFVVGNIAGSPDTEVVVARHNAAFVVAGVDHVVIDVLDGATGNVVSTMRRPAERDAFRVWAAPDLDADGKDDLLLASRQQLDAVRGDGTAIWSRADVSPDRVDPLAGDLNGDGTTDLVLSRNDSSAAVLVLRKATVFADGRTGVTLFELPADSSTDAEPTGDVDGDGRADVAVARTNDDGTATEAGVLRFDGTAAVWRTFPGSGQIDADADGDGVHDLTRGTEDGNGTRVDSIATGAPISTIDAWYPLHVSLDGNGDDWIGAIEGQAWTVDGRTGSVLWHFPKGSLALPEILGDVDGDGIVDLGFEIDEGPGLLHAGVVSGATGTVLWSVVSS